MWNFLLTFYLFFPLSLWANCLSLSPEEIFEMKPQILARKQTIIDMKNVPFLYFKWRSLSDFEAVKENLQVEVIDPDKQTHLLKFNERAVLKFSPTKTGRYLLKISLPLNPACPPLQKEFALTSNPPFPQKNKLPISIQQNSLFDFYQLPQGRIIRPKKKTIVALIDSGINYLNSEIRNIIHTNLKEIPNNGIDDDLNGFVDDVHGFDFVSQDEFPFDDFGHGTHVAGLIGSFHYGLNPFIKILPIKVLDAFDRARREDIRNAIEYALKEDVKIINLSIAGDAFSEEEYKKFYEPVLEMLKKYDALLITSAGNGLGKNKKFFPGAIRSPYILTVAALDHNKDLAPYTSWGDWVEITALGGSSSLPLVSWGSNCSPPYRCEREMFGSSMATAQVTTIAALIKSLYPDLKAPDIKQQIIEHSDALTHLNGKISGGLLNPRKALLLSH